MYLYIQYLYISSCISLYLYLSLCISIYLHVSPCIFMYLYIQYLYISSCISLYLYLSLCISIYLHVSPCIFMYLYIQYLYISLCILMYLHVFSGIVNEKLLTDYLYHVFPSTKPGPTLASLRSASPPHPSTTPLSLSASPRPRRIHPCHKALCVSPPSEFAVLISLRTFILFSRPTVGNTQQHTPRVPCSSDL